MDQQQNAEENGNEGDAGQIEWTNEDFQKQIQQIREQFAVDTAKSRGKWEAAMQQATLLNAKITQQFCVADLDAIRCEELEQEIREQKEQNGKNASQIQQLQAEKVALQNALHRIENGPREDGGGDPKVDLQFWAEKAQRQQILDQCIQALQASDHQTLQKVAKIVDKPFPMPGAIIKHRPPVPNKTGQSLFNSIGNNNKMRERQKNSINNQQRNRCRPPVGQLLTRLGPILDGDEQAAAAAEGQENENGGSNVQLQAAPLPSK